MAKRSRSSSTNYFSRRYLVEFAGTLMLVFVGLSAAIIGAPANALTIGIAFGLILAAIVYSYEGASGGHANPAVSIAMLAAGRLSAEDAVAYIIWQLLGGICGAALVALIVGMKGGTWAGIPGNLGQNGYEAGMFGGYSLVPVLITEFLATLVFTLVILNVTQGSRAMAALAIGLTLIALHLAFFNVDGLSVNPARSFGPAVLVQGKALTQVWVFLIVPVVAGAVAGWLSREKIA